MLKKLLSLILAIAMIATLSLGVTATAADEEPVLGSEPGEYYTYYLLAPANWFSTNDSIGLYYFTPDENAPWPGEEVKPENCVYTFEDGRRVFKVQVWQNDADTAEEIITVSTILFNSFVDASIDPVNGHQTDNINMEGYYADELEFLSYGEDTTMFPRYQEGFETLNFNNMIYVPNPELTKENEFSGAEAIAGGVWYYYWGDGKYGVTPQEPGDMLGDVNADNKVTLEDVVMVQRSIAKLVELNDHQTAMADVTKDEKITLDDVVLMQRFIAKLVDKF